MRLGWTVMSKDRNYRFNMNADVAKAEDEGRRRREDVTLRYVDASRFSNNQVYVSYLMQSNNFIFR